ncbi:MAG TPA: hypothetical protein VMR25_08650, partial [Planctomycetaceae bacterium]|nr:hypothetical protein [Planctomycetaceae bacterium]
MQQPGSEVPSITWTLTLQTTDNSTATVVYSDSALPTQFDSPAEQNRFIYPESALNYFVEAIGVAGPQNTVGRGLPQHPFSTFYNTGKNSFDLYFDDGTVQSLANVTTGGFDTRALRASVSKSADSPAAITIQPISELANTWGMLVAGELTAVTLSDSEMKLDITDLDQRVWTIHEAIATSKTVVLQPSSNSLPARRLADLEVGEYLLAACYTMKRDSNNSQQARHVRIAREDTALKASVCLLGKLEQQLDASAGLITVEGTDKYRVVTLNTPITKTDSQGVARPIARIKLWCDKITLQTAPQDTLVTLPALRVIYPETISVFAQPGPPDPGGISDLRSVPVHANVSEMITRWSGWSLTTPMPGRTDGDDSADSNPQSTLQFKNYRPDLTNPDCLTEEERERWKLPPLRFDRHYEICVRRVDLAGNHLYDEPLPPADALTQIQGYNVATSLYDDTVYMRARRAAKRQSAPKADIEGQPFTPATLAPPPLLGFPRARRSPAYAPPRKQAPIEPPATQSASSALGRAIMPARFRRGIHNNRAVPAQPTPSAPSTTVPIVVDDTSNYPIVAFDRDQTLYVLSDVLQILNPDTAEESARLLPPPAPVETVLLCGQLDKETVDKVVPIIRTHERYLDDRCNYHGIDPRGDLNYFGDWSAREFDVRLQSDSCETKLPLPRSKRDQRQLLSFFDDAWPKPRTINLLLVPGTRSYSPVRSGIPVDNYEISTTGPEKNASKITARVPPGVEAELQIVAKDQTGVWKSVQLMHATNGAWARPIWQALEETLSSPNTAPSTNRFLGGMMRLDVPSSGSFTIHAYWNDPGDQSVPTQYAPAEAIAHVKDGKVVNVEVVDAGFGFVTKAATLVESPARWPEIRPLVSDGKVIDFEILNAGEDCRYDLRYQMAPAQNGGSTKIEYAQVVARVNADGQVDRVELIGAIAGKNVPDACQMVPCVPRPPVLEAVCKDGKIDRVIVHDAGDGYEGDMRIRIIRQPPLVRIAEACVTERNEHGELCRIAVAQPGGWYASPPIVAAFDLDGDGCGAQLTAVLNSSGGVAEVKIVSRGLKYSHNVRIAFYTNQYQTPNQAIPAATPGERQDLCNIAFQHPIGDLRGRRVDYVVQLNSRF